jgi:hypothetical protein
MSFTFAFDVTAANYGSAPRGVQLAGYDTGPGIAWTRAMWDAHPGAVHIDQAPDLGGDLTADALDCEFGAVPVGSPKIATWATGAQASFRTAKRPGQRRPVLYQSASNVTANVNALIANGVISGVGLWIAKWDGNTAADIAALAAASGPFPVIGFQFADDGPYDADVFSTAWLADVSGSAPVTFGPPRNLTVAAGATSVLVQRCDTPAVAPAPVDHYEVDVFTGSYPSLATRVNSTYPRYMKQAPEQFGSLTGLPAGAHMTLRAVACTADGRRSAYADASFAMP